MAQISNQSSIEIITKSLQHIWHPCSQMKAFESEPPLLVHDAQGSILSTNVGTVIDAISSWWCKLLGHRHPKILSALASQLNKFEHVISANCTHEILANFGQRLSQITGLQHVYFASDGSSAVEIALKLALHVDRLKNPGSHKNTVLALGNGYHGETFATLGVSDLGIYKEPYKYYGLKSYFIRNIPYINTLGEAVETNFSMFFKKLNLDYLENNVFAIIFEPILQGAAGMKLYNPYFLQHLVTWAKERNIIVIADEIMTGIGRTGTWLASAHANISPDLICLSKGLSAGVAPIATVSISHEIYNYFYHLDNDPKKLFLHSHTHSANSLAVAASLATINIVEEEQLLQNSQNLGFYMLSAMQKLALQFDFIKNVRGGLGAWVAADLEDFGELKIKNLSSQMLKAGVLIRPINNTLYFLVPINSTYELIDEIFHITKKILFMS